MLACSLLLNPLRFVGGFDTVGDIEVSGLFRPLRVQPKRQAIQNNELDRL